jgi:hypothetical protein
VVPERGSPKVGPPSVVFQGVSYKGFPKANRTMGVLQLMSPKRCLSRAVHQGGYPIGGQPSGVPQGGSSGVTTKGGPTMGVPIEVFPRMVPEGWSGKGGSTK